jgi:dCTP deaminase
MILCDRETVEAIEDGRILVVPRPDESFMSSTSFDLTLGLPLEHWVIPNDADVLGLKFRPGRPGWNYDEVKALYLKPVELTSDQCYDLRPGQLVLGWTEQRIHLPYTSRLCARVEGRSSLARLGLGVHVTAPTIHAGFGYNKSDPSKSGAPLQLEIWNTGPLPVELKVGMRICQVIIEEVRERPSAGYRGQFNLQGPQPTT